jgi:drug/metabolite transporter (DMT)-like permease
MPYIIVAIFLWSSLGIVIRFSGAPVTVLIFFSCIISSLLMGVVIIRKGLSRNFPKGKNLSGLFVLAIVSLINTFSFFYSYKNTTIANAVLTHYTAPIMVALLSPFFLKERLTLRIFIAVVLATTGLWIMLDMSLQQFYRLLIAGDRNTAGIFAGLFSGFAYAVLVIVIRILAPRLNPVVMAFSQNLLIAVFISPFISFSKDLISALWAFFFMGIIHSTIAPILYFRGMRDVKANKAAILGYLEPVCAILLGIIFLGEFISLKTIIGGFLIILSGYITIKSKDS